MEGDTVRDERGLECTKIEETDEVLVPNRGTKSKELEEHKFVEPACLSTNESLCRLPEEPRTERVLGYFGPGDEGHNTLSVPLHWSEGIKWFQIWTVCWHRGNE